MKNSMKNIMKKRRKAKKGFTMIELMIVITVIGILAIVLLPRIAGIREEARTQGIDTNMRSVIAGLELEISRHREPKALAQALINRIQDGGEENPVTGRQDATARVEGEPISADPGTGMDDTNEGIFSAVDGQAWVLGIVYAAGYESQADFRAKPIAIREHDLDDWYAEWEPKERDGYDNSADAGVNGGLINPANGNTDSHWYTTGTTHPRMAGMIGVNIYVDMADGRLTADIHAYDRQGDYYSSLISYERRGTEGAIEWIEYPDGTTQFRQPIRIKR